MREFVTDLVFTIAIKQKLLYIHNIKLNLPATISQKRLNDFESSVGALIQGKNRQTWQGMAAKKTVYCVMTWVDICAAKVVQMFVKMHAQFGHVGLFLLCWRLGLSSAEWWVTSVAHHSSVSYSWPPSTSCGYGLSHQPSNLYNINVLHEMKLSDWLQAVCGVYVWLNWLIVASGVAGCGRGCGPHRVTSWQGGDTL